MLPNHVNQERQFFFKMMPRVYDFIYFYTQFWFGGTGGFLHIVLDDGNVDDESVWYCQEQASLQNDTFGYFLATLLRFFTEDEREVMYADGWGDYHYTGKERSVHHD